LGLFTSYKKLNDEELMARFQSKREERAFSELYNRYSKRLLFFMYKMLSCNEPLAQDKLHDVFTKIVERPERFDASKNFKTWVFTVAANECRKHYRKEPMQPLSEQHYELSFNPNDVLKQLDGAAFKKQLDNELLKMTYAHRSTFVLRFQEHLSVKEIAEIMQCSEGTVKSRSFYCLKILAEKLSVFNPIEK
jgi:RNA polymerase sigma-70 factor (ECF subfamily)